MGFLHKKNYCNQSKAALLISCSIVIITLTSISGVSMQSSTVNFASSSYPLGDLIDTPMRLNGNVLLVDNDMGYMSPFEYIDFYEEALTETFYSYDIWDMHEMNQWCPSPSLMLEYDAVVWFTGTNTWCCVDLVSQANLTTYLNNGGRLFITGRDIGYDLGWNEFYGDILHAQYHEDDAGREISGESGDIIGGGLYFSLCDIIGGPADWNILADGISPINGAVSCFNYIDGTPYYGGLRIEVMDARLIYLSFGFENIDNLNDRAT